MLSSHSSSGFEPSVLFDGRDGWRLDDKGEEEIKEENNIYLIIVYNFSNRNGLKLKFCYNLKLNFFKSVRFFKI